MEVWGGESYTPEKKKRLEPQQWRFGSDVFPSFSIGLMFMFHVHFQGVMVLIPCKCAISPPSKPYKSAPVGRVGYKFAKSQIALPIGSMYGIFTYICLIFMVNVGEYTSPMDPMGYTPFFFCFWRLERNTTMWMLQYINRVMTRWGAPAGSSQPMFQRSCTVFSHRESPKKNLRKIQV